MAGTIHRAFARTLWLVLLCLASLAAAAPLTWDADPATAEAQGGGGAWNTSSNNWWDGTANTTWNSATPDAATFGGTGAAGVVTVGENVTADSLTFANAGTGNYTLGGTATLTVNNGVTFAKAATINAPLALGGSQNWTTANGQAAIHGGIALGANTLTLATLNSDIRLSATGGPITGSGGITRSATTAARLLYSGTHTYSGPTLVAARADYATALEISGGELTIANSDVTMNGRLDIWGGPLRCGALNGTGRVYANGNATNFTGTGLYVGANNASGSFGGVISNYTWNTKARLGVVKLGTGTQTFTGTGNTFTGGLTIEDGTVIANMADYKLVCGVGNLITINRGTLRLNSVNVTSGNINYRIGTNGVLTCAGYHEHLNNVTLQGGTINAAANAGLNAPAKYNTEDFTLDANVVVTGNVASAIDLSGGANAFSLTAERTFTVYDVTTNANPDLTITGRFRAGGRFIKDGPGTVAFATAHAATAGYFVRGGTARFDVLQGLVNNAANAVVISNAGARVLFNKNNVIAGEAVAIATPITAVAGGEMDTAQFNTIGALTLNAGTLRLNKNDYDGGNYGAYYLHGAVTVGPLGQSQIAYGSYSNAGVHLDAPTTFTVNDSPATNDLVVGVQLTNRRWNAGAGALTKAGPGTMVLTAANNNYTGNTTINAGTLRLDGAGITPPTCPQITIATGAALDVSTRTNAALTLAGTQTLACGGTVRGTLRTSDGTRLFPGTDGGAGTCAVVGSLTVAHNTALTFDLAATTETGSGTNDLIQVVSNLTLTGRSPVTLAFARGTPATLPATYTLFKYGTLTGGATNLVAQNRGVLLAVDAVNQAITATLTTAGGLDLVWKGDGLTNRWDVGTSTNWLTAGNPTAFYQSDRVTFDNTGTNAPAVQLTGRLTVNRLTVTADQAYTLTGGSIGGSGALEKSGSGTLTLQPADIGDNTYAGGTVVNGGTLNLYGHNLQGSVVGTGPLQVNTGAVVVAFSSNPLGQYSGATLARLVVNGGTYLADAYHHLNSLTLSGGLVGVRAGVAQVDGLDFNTWTATSPAITVQASTNTATVASKLTLRAATTLDVANGAGITDCLLSGAMAGTGPLTKNGAGKAVLTGLADYTGATTVNGGTFAITGGGRVYANRAWDSRAFTVNNAQLEIDGWLLDACLGKNNYTAGNLVLNNARLVYVGTSNAVTGPTDASNGRAFTIGAGGATLEVANADATWTFCRYNAADGYLLASAGGLLTLTGAGHGVMHKIIPGAGGLTKSGTGAWTLAGTNTYTGVTRVEAGVLLANGPVASPAVTVADKATLGGEGLLLGTLTVENGGTLAPGAASGAIGTLSVSNTVTLADGARLDWDGAATAGDLVSVTGDVALPAVLNLSVTLADGQMQNPAVVLRWTGANTGAATPGQWIIPGGYSAAIVGSEVWLTKGTGTVLIVR